ncbi:MAG: hypothetical protein H6817_00470 [Phycisphaerales bacterium]|nr:hypothetical protein [Phycisphaerales bacterium]
MRTHRFSTIVGLVVTLCAVSGFAQSPSPEKAEAGPSLAEVEKQITEAWAKHNTLKLRVHSLIRTPNAVRTVELSGTVMVRKKDGQEEYRRDTTTTTTLGSGAATRVDTINVLEICDGKTAHMVRNSGLDSKVYRVDPSRPQRVAGAALIEQLKANGTLTVAPPPEDESLDYFVLKVKLRDPAPPADMVEVHVDRDTGVMNTQILYDATGGEIQTVHYLDHKLDVELDPDFFDFLLPEGVEYIDTTEPDNGE